MINFILKGLVAFITFLIDIFLAPIDLLITSYLPAIDEGLSYVDSFFNYILDFIPWILSWFNLPTAFISLVIGYWVFKLTVPYLVHSTKLLVAWWSKIAP